MYDRHDKRESRPAETVDCQGITRAIGSAALAGADSPYPHRDAIQAAFGRHDLGDLRAATGGSAVAAAQAIGADAYALGDRVAFRSAPSLEVAAHEAAHVAVGRRGGGVGRDGDADERDADAVAHAVVRGESAEPLLDRAGAGTARGDVLQRTQIGGLDSANPNYQMMIRQYLADPHRSYQELTQIRGQVLADRHAGWDTWIAFIDEQLHRWQVDDVSKQGTHHNYGSGMMTADSNLLHLDQQPVKSGTATTSFSLPTGLMQTPDVEVSHKDSEVVILEKMLHKILPQLVHGAPPEEITVQLVSTNGACNACKGRLHDFANQVIAALRQRGWSYALKLRINYRYLKAPRDTTRFLGGRNQPGAQPVPTTYGHRDDMQTTTALHGEVYEHRETHSFDPEAEGTLAEMTEQMEVESAFVQAPAVDQLTAMFQGMNL